MDTRCLYMELVDLNLQHISLCDDYISTQNESATSRKRARGELIGHKVEKSAPYLVLSNTTVEYEGQVEGEMPNGKALIQLTLKDPKISLDKNGNLVLSSLSFARTTAVKKKIRIPSCPVVTLRPSQQNITVVQKEINILSSFRKKHIDVASISVSPLILSIKPKDGINLDVHLKWDYRISVLETLYASIPTFVKSRLQELIEATSGIQTDTVETTKIVPRFFYDLVTENTENKIPKCGNEIPLVPNLDTNLLKFQGTTLQWLLWREHCSYNYDLHLVDSHSFWTQDMENNITDVQMQQKLDQISFGFELVNRPFTTEKIWYNKYTGNFCSKPQMFRYLNQIALGNPYRGSGVLSEEMGLGKTVEMVSLILLNQRPKKDQDVEFYDTERERNIKKAKTNLIVCPSSILYQWVEEISLHAPSLKVMVYEGFGKAKDEAPREIAKKFAMHDVVITTFQTITREIHHAMYNPKRPKRNRKKEPTLFKVDYDGTGVDPEAVEALNQHYREMNRISNIGREREDYSSPLMLIEFWRMIVDEVQLMGSTMSNSCTIATMIPRFHSWGVSGTPIKSTVDDLSSLLAFLNMHPFMNKNAFSLLLENPQDFKRFFQGITLRHTKEMVKNDIHIPPQRKILLTVPFGPIEQNNYEEMYQMFLQDVGLNENGAPIVDEWEPSSSYYSYMRSWLTRLRRICCHANIGKNIHDKPSLQTMDRVLDDMIQSSRHKITSIEREITLCILEQGQVMEYAKAPNEALRIWLEELPNVQKKIEELSEKITTDKADTELSVNVLSLRAHLDLLHRIYFFVASAHYQLYNPAPEVLLPRIGTSDKSIFSKDLEKVEIDPMLTFEESSDGDPVVVYRVLNEKETEHQNLETDYYAKAQQVRREILSDAIKNVNKATAKLDKNFGLEKFNSNPLSFSFSSTSVKNFMHRINTVVSELNTQSRILNKWIKEVLRLLSTTLLDTVTQPDGEEYGDSLIIQEKVAAYLDVIQRAMKERKSLIFGKDEHKIFQIEDIDAVVDSSDIKIREELEAEYPELDLLFSLRYLMIESKSIQLKTDSETATNNESLQLRNVIIMLNSIFDKAKNELSSFQKNFRNMNYCYNLRITYFKQLQELSDNVRSLVEVYTNEENLNTEVLTQQLEHRIEMGRNTLHTLKSRLRYLESLAGHDSVDNQDRICAICRGDITIGSLTKCGHQYCKDCLAIWLRKSPKCPICKERINNKDIYNFTYKRDELNFRVVSSDSIGVNYSESGELFQIYHKLERQTLDAINSQDVKNDYGSKVNIIVKQILWLKKHDPNVQIVIYSQWAQLLTIIANALNENNVSYLGSKTTLDKNGSIRPTDLKTDVAIFKKDTSVTCFLLNAKAEASGLTLVNATHVFLCEPLVNTALELQAISRIHRIGQKKPTTVWIFAISGSVEDSIMLLTTRKRLKETEKVEEEELSKTTKSLVEKQGEFVENDDLWNSFFSTKTSRVV